jgi:hypothetical protein
VITERAVIESAVPKNNEVTNWLLNPLAKWLWYRNHTAPNPIAKGNIIPVKLILMACFPFCLICFRSTSKPAMNMSKMMPILAIPSNASKACGVDRNTFLKRSGDMAPSRVGPTMMPAKISPIMAGSLYLRHSSPSNLAGIRIIKSISRKCIISDELSFFYLYS